MYGHDHIRRLFERANELAGADRESFLMRECAAAPELLERLRAMLAAAADDRFLILPDHDSSPTKRTQTMTRSIVITGCSSGFGRLAAERFARAGDRVFATMRDPVGRNAKVSHELSALARDEKLDLRVLDLDVCSDDSVGRAAEQVLAAGGAPDVVVNNAGQMFVGVTEAFDSEEFGRQLDINVLGVHRMNRAFLPAMRAQGRGLFVNISSVAGRIAVPFFGIYHASKWALEGYSQALRTELATTGVDVVLVQPGPFTTALFPTSPKPKDADGRAASYPAIVHETFEGMGKAFEQMFESEDTPTDPALVVDRIVELADMAPGSRPFRSAVGVDFGVHELNELCKPHHEGVIAAMELEQLATLAGAATGRTR